MPIEVGQDVLHYRLIEKIGEGGMGAVWKAEDTKLRRHVALKILPETVAADLDRRKRFEREARAVAALNHPNIVTLYSVEHEEGRHFITMELVEGKTLTQLLPSGGFQLSRLLEIAIPLVDAVSRAHREGITHRDLKPDNIMIDHEGRLRVLDFGLAKLQAPPRSEDESQADTLSAATVVGRVLGTAPYMSPEQADGKAVDPRSDVFSLGTILYEMASGERPFRGETPMSTIGAILRDEPVPITDLRRSLPNHAGRIIRRCLAKDPDRRYQTAIDLRNELDELKAEIGSGAHADGDRPPSPGRRQSMRIGWVIGAVIVVVAALSFLAFQQEKNRSTTRAYVSVPLTAMIGQDFGPTWSPEGEFIAFGRTREGSIDLMVQPVAGGEASVRASGPGDERPARWSPDGRYLAYVSTTESGTFVSLVPPHGGAPQKLIGTGVPTLDIGTNDATLGIHPWDPESRTLLVTRVADSGQLAIFRVIRENGEAEQVSFPPSGSDDRSASYSFDGERIVFERRRHSRNALMIISATGNEPKELLADEFDYYAPAFRPDGRHALFLSNRVGPGFDLWELDIETGATSQLTFESNTVGSFSVSATNRVAYVPFWHDTFLYVVDVATGERSQLTSHTKDNFGARFSPDGAAVAYHSTRTGDAEIFIHYLDGRPETQVTDNPSQDVSPNWSPNGERLIFSSSRQDGVFKLFIADSDGGGERLLIDQPILARDTYSPAAVSRIVNRWSPDGKRIAYLMSTEATTSLWTIGPDGEGAREVLQGVGSFDWYRDSRHLIYTRRNGNLSEIIAADLESGEERSLYIGTFIEMEVAPDGSALTFTTGAGHMSLGLALLKLEAPVDPSGLPRALGEPEYVVRPDGIWHTHLGGWSPDSKRLVYTQDTDYGDIFELVERQ